MAHSHCRSAFASTSEVGVHMATHCVPATFRNSPAGQVSMQASPAMLRNLSTPQMQASLELTIPSIWLMMLQLETQAVCRRLRNSPAGQLVAQELPSALRNPGGVAVLSQEHWFPVVAVSPIGHAVKQLSCAALIISVPAGHAQTPAVAVAVPLQLAAH